MKVYFIHPSLTLEKHEQAKNFYDICYKEMEEHIEVVNVKSETVMLSIDIVAEDFILFFNRNDQNYNSTFFSFLTDALANKAKFFPIAISKDHRVPPSPLSTQSFDVIEALEICLKSLIEAKINSI